MDGYWHQFTVRWKSSEGDWAIYKDAILQGEGKEPLFSNGTIPHGILRIGSRPVSLATFPPDSKLMPVTIHYT